MSWHEAGHHERLRLSTALGEAPLDEKDVKALSGHDVRAASRESARSAASSASARALSSPTSTT